MKPKTHETFLIGINKKGKIVFLKSYNYKLQKEEAQLDADFVAKKFDSWHFGSMQEFLISHIEHGSIVSTHNIIIKHP
jgi:hypothetical protein